MLAATAVAHVEGPFTVQRILQLSGVGRATFYEYFDDAAHALATAHVSASTRMHEALAQRPQTLNVADETVTWLCSRWFETVLASPMLFLSVFSMRSEPLSEPARCFQTELRARLPLSRCAQTPEVALMIWAAAAQALAHELAKQRPDTVKTFAVEDASRTLASSIHAWLRTL